jgi:hypothetical protein
MTKRKLQEFEAGTAEDHVPGHADPYTSFVNGMRQSLPKKPRLTGSMTSANHTPLNTSPMLTAPYSQKMPGSQSGLVSVEELDDAEDMARSKKEVRCEDLVLQKTTNISDDEDGSSQVEMAALKAQNARSEAKIRDLEAENTRQKAKIKDLEAQIQQLSISQTMNSVYRTVAEQAVQRGLDIRREASEQQQRRLIPNFEGQWDGEDALLQGTKVSIWIECYGVPSAERVKQLYRSCEKLVTVERFELTEHHSYDSFRLMLWSAQGTLKVQVAAKTKGQGSCGHLNIVPGCSTCSRWIQDSFRERVLGENLRVKQTTSNLKYRKVDGGARDDVDASQNDTDLEMHLSGRLTSEALTRVPRYLKD